MPCQYYVAKQGYMCRWPGRLVNGYCHNHLRIAQQIDKPEPALWLRALAIRAVEVEADKRNKQISELFWNHVRDSIDGSLSKGAVGEADIVAATVWVLENRTRSKHNAVRWQSHMGVR